MHPKTENWACFVRYLKIINNFLKINMSIIKQMQNLEMALTFFCIASGFVCFCFSFFFPSVFVFCFCFLFCLFLFCFLFFVLFLFSASIKTIFCTLLLITRELLGLLKFWFHFCVSQTFCLKMLTLFFKKVLTIFHRS